MMYFTFIFANMTLHQKKSKWMNLPSYPGGKEAFSEFISKNIKYPQEAIDAKIEGSVIVEYSVSDNGNVIDPRIVKGLGYGCDEEAIRVISLMQFNKVKNRKMRVKLTTKATIHFNIGKSGFTYSIAETPKPEPLKPVSDAQSSGTSYSYTIEF
jgi:TonB family protein